VSKFARDISSTLKKDMPSLLTHNRKEKEEFEKRLFELWKEPLDMLEAFLHLSIEIGYTVNRELQTNAEERDSVLIDVLTRLHGQACLIGGEILALLRSGYADGANARWRSLHEVVVVASFIQKNGAEVARRYFEHSAIESYRALKEYQKHQKSLKLEPLSAEEIVEIYKERNQLIRRYGKSYGQSNGWASSVFKLKNPKITDIERSVGLSHLRPYYRMASHHIHSSPKSILFKLGLTQLNPEVILAGPSNAGLADPGQGMAISLNQINNVLLVIKPSLMGLISQTIMSRWVEEICEEFIKVHKIVETQWLHRKTL
jgi:hypothetical protein